MSSPESDRGSGFPVIERHRSYGIGGAGNMRASDQSAPASCAKSMTGRASEIKELETAEQPEERRRRDSLMSTLSGRGRRASVVKAVSSMFRKGSTTSVEEDGS